MKESLRRKMVSGGCSPRATRFRYPGEVSGPADERICLLGTEGRRWRAEGSGCYLGLGMTGQCLMLRGVVRGKVTLQAWRGSVEALGA